VFNVSDVRQIEIHTTEPLIPDASHFEVETAIAKLKKYRFPGSDQIPIELSQAGGETLVSPILNSLILFGIEKNCLISGRSLLLQQFTKRVIRLSVVITMGISLLSTSYRILLNIFLSRFRSMRR
jgi:hypothetical protein